MTASMDAIKDMFDVLDVDGSGSVNAAEVEGLMKEAGLEKPKEAAEGLMKQCDKDGDAKITWDEFRTAMETFIAEMKEQQQE